MKYLKDNMLKLYGSVFNTYDNDKKNLIKIKDILHSSVEECFWQYARKNYWIIGFDSPAGEDSENLLNSIGIPAVWKGTPGYRGQVAVFLPRNKYKECPDLKKVIETMSRLDNRYEDLNYLFDKDSIIEIE
jgi:hypothetical protein